MKQAEYNSRLRNFVNDKRKAIGKTLLHLTLYTIYVEIFFCLKPLGIRLYENMKTIENISLKIVTFKRNNEFCKLYFVTC